MIERSGYDDFRVVLTSRGDAAGRIYDVVAYSRGGRHRGTFELPFADDELGDVASGIMRGGGTEDVIRDAGLGDERQAADPRERLKERGARLASALLRDSVLDGFENALARAKRERKQGVRLTLSLEGSSPLLNVPWEVLYHDNFLATQRSTPVVRQLADTRSVEGPPPVDTAIQILGVVASPKGLAKLDVAQERRTVEAAIAKVDKERVALTWLEPATWDQLREALLCPPPHHVLHFIGHSAYREGVGGVLYLENSEDGSPHEIKIEDLRVLLGDESLRLVVLNSCEAGRTPSSDAYGGVATGLIDLGIPAVVAMQYRIRDDSAIDFAAALYRTLIDQQRPIAAAVSEARKALFGERRDPIGWCTPVLYVAEPDVELFDFQQPALPPSVEPRPPTPPGPIGSRQWGKRWRVVAACAAVAVLLLAGVVIWKVSGSDATPIGDWDGAQYDVGFVENVGRLDGYRTIDFDRLSVDGDSGPLDADDFTDEPVEYGWETDPFTNLTTRTRLFVLSDDVEVLTLSAEASECGGPAKTATWDRVPADALGDEAWNHQIASLTYSDDGLVERVRFTRGCEGQGPLTGPTCAGEHVPDPPAPQQLDPEQAAQLATVQEWSDRVALAQPGQDNTSVFNDAKAVYPSWWVSSPDVLTNQFSHMQAAHTMWVRSASDGTFIVGSIVYDNASSERCRTGFLCYRAAVSGDVVDSLTRGRLLDSNPLEKDPYIYGRWVPADEATSFGITVEDLLKELCNGAAY